MTTGSMMYPQHYLSQNVPCPYSGRFSWGHPCPNGCKNIGSEEDQN